MAQENYDQSNIHPAPEGKDDESIISDRCWEEMYRGDSRKWLTFDGSRKKTDPSICSTMKETYRIPRREEEVSHVGRRRELLLQKFLDDATAEIVRERDEPPPVEEYCTEYDGNYNLPGFEPEKEPHSKNVEETYEKKYSTEEEQKRFHIFQENLEKITRHNKLYQKGLVSYKMGINQFADMTEEEFKNSLKRPENLASKTQNINMIYSKSRAPVPDSVDWRNKGYVTPVENEGAFGASWIFSVTSSIESCYAVTTGKLIPLSKTYLSDCVKDCNDNMCAFTQIILNHGMPSVQTYPNNTNGTCEYKPSQNIFNLTEFAMVLPGRPDSEFTLQKSIALTGPSSVGLDATKFQFYVKGVFDDPTCGNLINHDAVVVGYGSYNSTGTAEDYWIIKNSWGVSWGEKGYMRLARNKNNMCGITDMALNPVF